MPNSYNRLPVDTIGRRVTSSFERVSDIYPADGLLASIIFPSAVAPHSKDFAFGEILSFALPKESIQRKRNPIPLESPLKINSLRRWGNSCGATVAALKHSPA